MIQRPSVDGYDERDWSRLHGTEDEDERSPFARDYDRLIYTPEFRRLQGKTQVASAGEADFFRTRLTHTIEVAQVARRLAESVNRRAAAARRIARVAQYLDDASEVGRLPPAQHKVDPDLIEAAAVLHDIGHPPFAHVGETALNTALLAAAKRFGIDGSGGFNGNAQSFRLAVKVMSHHGSERGRQLTLATLDAALKYPWTRGQKGVPEPKKWSVNPTELAELDQVRTGIPAKLRHVQTLEAQIMDWADDLAYSVHDLEDWYRAGYMPLAHLADPASREQAEFVDFVVSRWTDNSSADPDRLAACVRELMAARLGPFETFRLAREAREPIFDPTTGSARRAVRRLRANVFDDATTGFKISARPGAGDELPRRYRLIFEPDDATRFKVAVLQELLWLYVVDDSRMATQQHGHNRVVSWLFEVHAQALFAGELRLFPGDRRRHLESETEPLERLRSVADYICDLTDADALRLHERLRSGDAQLLAYM